MALAPLLYIMTHPLRSSLVLLSTQVVLHSKRGSNGRMMTPRLLQSSASLVTCPSVWPSGLMQNQEDIVEYFKRKGVSSIFLFRRNLLRRLVSLLANSHDRDAKQLNGTHKAHVHSRHEAEVLARFKPLIDVERLIPDMKQTRKWSTDILQYFKGTRHIAVYYEDLLRNQAKMMDVLDFLRIPHAKLTSRHVKIHTRPLSDHIENWDVVSKALKGTDYECFLHSDYQRK